MGDINLLGQKPGRSVKTSSKKSEDFALTNPQKETSTQPFKHRGEKLSWLGKIFSFGKKVDNKNSKSIIFSKKPSAKNIALSVQKPSKSKKILPEKTRVFTPHRSFLPPASKPSKSPFSFIAGFFSGSKNPPQTKEMPQKIPSVTVVAPKNQNAPRGAITPTPKAEIFFPDKTSASTINPNTAQPSTLQETVKKRVISELDKLNAKERGENISFNKSAAIPKQSAPFDITRKSSPTSRVSRFTSMTGEHDDGVDVNFVPGSIPEHAEARARKFGIIVVACFVVVMVLYLGLVGYGFYLRYSNQNTSLEIQKINHEIQTYRDVQARAQATKIHLDTLKTLLDRHVYWTRFLSYLEKYTISSTYYSEISGDVAGRISLTASTDSYRTLAQQLIVLENAHEFVEKVEVTDGSVQETPIMNENGEEVDVAKRILFKIDLTVKPQVFSFESNP